MCPEHPDSAVTGLMAKRKYILSCNTKLMQQNFRLKQNKLIYINNCPTRCNTKQSIYYSASSLYMFRVSTTPIIRSTQNCNYNVAKLAWSSWREVCAQKIWPIPETVVTVLCTPDDRYGWHPKHAEWTCRIINRLICIYLSINQLDAQFFCFTISLFHASACFEHHVLETCRGMK